MNENDHDEFSLAAAMIGGVFLLALVLFVAAMWASPANSHHTPHHTWLLSWIPHSCCVTNDCCHEVSERDVTSLPNDNWKINVTGQVLRRTANSPDGKYYRCYCDYDAAAGKWVVHPTASTRCIFPPLLGF